jgi:hypothetical protein
MSQSIRWYRSDQLPPRPAPSLRRTVRDWIRASLPEPSVVGKTMVLCPRRTLPKRTRSGFGSEFHGLFSEFHSVLGALAYAEAHGAHAVRVEFDSPLYVEPVRGSNWWTYYFERGLMRLEANMDEVDQKNGGPDREVRLDRAVSKYGRYGGFSDLVQGATPYLYPMTFGIDRDGLFRLVSSHIEVRREIADEVDRLAATLFEPGSFRVGVHYRGTDATHGWSGLFNHYRREPVPYDAYVDEVRHVLERQQPRAYQVFVATDEVEFLERMRREFADRIVAYHGSPRVSADSQAVHLDRSLAVSNHLKGKSALIDCLLLAATNYLVKGRSNLSDASLVFAPRLPYSFCPDVFIDWSEQLLER